MSKTSWFRTVLILAVLIGSVLSSVSTGLAQRRFRASGVPTGPGDPITGTWLNFTNWPIEAIHAALVPTGTFPNIVWKVLIWDRGRPAGSDTLVDAQLWDWECTPTPGQPLQCFDARPQLRITNSNQATILSAGHSFLDDGKLLVTGGSFLNVGAQGPRINHVFDPAAVPPATPFWQRRQDLREQVCQPIPPPHGGGLRGRSLLPDEYYC